MLGGGGLVGCWWKKKIKLRGMGKNIKRGGKEELENFIKIELNALLPPFVLGFNYKNVTL